MTQLKAKLGYATASLTLVAAVLAPFVLYGYFTKAVASLNLKVDEMYSGGPVVRTVQANNYRIDIHRQVSPHMLQTEKSFVQLDWRPVGALPPHVSDTVDIDGDGKPDVHVQFDVPKDPKAPLRVNVESLNPRYTAMHDVGKQKFSCLIVRVDDAVLVRVPVT
jgi:hypothetical protein